MILKRQFRVLEQNQEPIAFILGSYLTSGLGIVRNLGRMKVPTVVYSSDKHQLSFYSCYTTGIICPDPRFNEEDYIALLLEIGEQLPQKGVLLPISDTDTITILKHQDKLAKYYHFTSAEFGIVNTFLNKRLFYQFLKKKQIDHPATFFPQTTEDIAIICKKIAFPCIVKPVYSSYFVQDFQKKVFIANSSKELLNCYQIAQQHHHEVLIQEILPGEPHHQCGFNAYYTRTFKPVGSFMYQRIREWPHHFGNGCYIESIWRPDLEKIVTKLVKAMGYYGIIDAEFKIDPRDNTLKLIEINPRTWMQNSLPTYCGFNIPYFAYCDALGKPLKSISSRRENVKWIYSVDVVNAAWKSLREGSLCLHDWGRSYQGEKIFAVLAKDDPFPFFLLCAKLVFSPFKLLLKPR